MDKMNNIDKKFSVGAHGSDGLPWWRHQTETFSTLLALCEEITGEFSSQRPVMRSFDVFLWSAPEQTVK